MNTQQSSPLQYLSKAVWSALLFISLAGFAAEQVETTGTLTVPRKNHTATVLADGRVVVVGGENSAGQVASAEVYDPATRTFTAAGSMSHSRVGHAATLLANGTVLITGGRDLSGSLSSAEIFDPSLVENPFRTLTASMGAARARHTATLMADGKVLIAGGDLSGTAEIFDPVTETFSTSLIAMIEPRAGQSATTLQENSVLLAGGGTRSVELFDTQTNLFLSWPSVLNEIRAGQSAITTSDSSVFFVGGEELGTLERFDLLGSGSSSSLSLGAPSSSASQLANGKVLVLGPALATLFNPATSTLLPVANAGPLQRSGQTVTELPSDKHILVVGGIDASTSYVAPAALYNPARIETDKQDYYPDEPVIVYGSGWKPGEDVDLYVVDNLGWLYDSTATADAEGLFTADPYFVVLMQHLGVTFDLRAVGAQSGLQAKHTFTDSPKVGSVTVGAQVGTLTYGTAASVSYTVTVNRGSGGGSSGAFTATMSVTSGLPAGATATFSPNPVSFASGNTTKTTTLTVTTAVGSLAGPYTLTVKASTSASDEASGTGSLTIGAKAITGNFTADNKTYDGNVTASVLARTLVGVLAADSANVSLTSGTATFADANAANGKTVTLTGASLTGSAAGNYSLTSVAATTANITALGITGNFTASTKVYDATTTATILTRTLSGVISPDVVTLTGGTATFADANAATGKTVTGTGFTLGGANAGNYTLSSVGTTTADILKANATVVVTPYTVTYDGTLHTAAGTAKGVSNESLSGLDLSVTAHTNAGTYSTDAWVFTDVTGNYNNANGTVSDSIAKANAVIVVTPYSVTYDGTAHTATGTAKGVLNESLSGLVLSSTTHTNAGTYAADAWSFTDATGNYNSTSGTVSDSIAKANAVIVVTPYSVTYTGTAHTATGTATGVLGEALAGLNLTATTHTNAGAYATDAWVFTDVTGNYNDANGTTNDSIAKANATIVVTPYSVTYDGAAHTATGTAKGVLNESLSGLVLAGTTHTNAGSYATDAWVFTDVTGNYNDANGTVSNSIAKANATIVVTPYSVTYTGSAHTATGTATGVLSESLAGLDLTATIHTNAGSYTNDAWTFTDVTGNYNNGNGTISDSIAKANAVVTVTGYTGIYDSAAHGASGTAKGIQGESLAGLNLGSSFTDVPGGTAHWVFTDITGNYNNTFGSADIVITKATATINVSGYSGIYDGAAHGAASGTATGVSGTDLSAALNLGATFTDVPGGTAHWTFSGGTNYNDDFGSVAIVISKANADVQVAGYAGIFDGLPHGATGSATGVGGVSLSGLDLGSSFTDVPGGTAHWVFTDVTGNYNNAFGTAAVVINKATASVNVSGYTGTYDGAAHGATGSATGIGGVSLPGLDLGASFTNFPGGTANWTFAGGTNYNDQNGTASIVINKATASISVTPYNVTYDGNLHTATGTATGVGGANLNVGLTLSATMHTNAGTYGSDAWSFSGGTNYTDQNGTVSDSIAKADALVTINGYSGIYDALPHNATGSATGIGGVILSGLDLGASFTNAPGGTAHWVFTDVSGNYNDTFGTAAIVITKATASISVSGLSVTYDGTARGASGTATGVNSENLSAGLDLGATFTNAPGGTAHWVFSGGTNYNDDVGDVAIVISKANADVQVAGYTGTFDGLSHSATGSATGVGGVSLPGLDLGASFTNVPGGTASWTFTGGTNYNDQNGTVSIVINKATASISVTPYNVTYDGNPHTATGTATGVGGANLNASLTLSGTMHTNAGAYGSDAWSFAGGTNYDDQSGTVADSIAKASATVTVDGYTGVYDGAAHGATGSATGVGGVSLSGLDLGASFTNAPGGTANWTFTGGVNYQNDSGTAAIVITKANPTITWNNPASIVYGAALNATQLNAAASVPGTLTYSPAAGTILNAGVNQILHVDFTPTDSTNYNSVSKDVMITVAKATPVITWSAPTSIIYGTALSAVQLNATASVPGTLTYTPALGTILNTGIDQTLHVDFVPTDSSNYESVSKEVKITVNPWTWTGFFQPVDNFPVLNRVKAGSAIPVKFSLGGNKGLAIFENGYPLSGTIPTSGSEPTIDIEVTVNAGASSLSYDASSNQYVYVWKTDKSWGGSARRLLLKLKDGTLHYADFNFTK